MFQFIKNLFKESNPIERADGSKEWYLNGKLHREDGPAVEYTDGTKYWYLNGERHRTDGPAVEGVNGYKVWYLNGVEYEPQDLEIEIGGIKMKKKT